jgi:hypothetical protein
VRGLFSGTLKKKLGLALSSAQEDRGRATESSVRLERGRPPSQRGRKGRRLMARESLDRLREALARLPTASRAELSAEWHRLYRSEPPARLGPNLLIAAIAYRLQEQALGGLRPELQRRLHNIAEEVGRDAELDLAAAPHLKPGTRLREWQGRTHQVLVGEIHREEIAASGDAVAAVRRHRDTFV